MHRARKSFLSVLSALLLLLAALGFAACTQTETYTLTLMDGDSVYFTESAAEGTAIEYPADPTRENYTFNGWYLTADGTGTRQELPTEMPAEDRTYYAGWTAQEEEPVTPTASYTIEIYLQNLTQDGYEEDEEATRTGTAEVGSNVTVPEISGFILNTEMSTSVTNGQVAISSNAANNVFAVYYDRAAYTVVYNANAPQGTVAEGTMDEELNGVYGQSFTLAECGYTLSGYRFAGWSTSADGEVQYRPGDSYTLTANGQLYAVWSRGYINAFGGEDVIYLGEEGVATLVRGGRDFTGSYTTGEDGVTTFSFTLGNGELLTGEMGVGGYYFAYFGSLAEGTYQFFDSYERQLDSTNTITVTGGVNAVWAYTDETGASFSYSGSILPADEEGMYLFLITSGDAAGNGFTFRFTIVTNNSTGEEFDAYVRRGTEADIGTVVRAMPSATNTGSYSLSSSESLVFDGYGNVAYTTSGSSYNFYYEFIEDDSYDVVSIYGYTSAGVRTEVFRARLISFTSGGYGFVPYYSALDLTFTIGNPSDQTYLTLDGYGMEGIYQQGTTEIRGQFTITQSRAYSAYIIDFAGQIKVMISVSDAGASSNAESLPYSYGEYLRLDQDSSGELNLYYPILVFNRNGDNTAQYIYANSTTGEAYIIGTGTGVYDSETGLWTFTNTLADGMEAYESMLPAVMQIALDTENYIYDVYYYASVGTGEEEESYLSTYTAEDGATLVVFDITGVATYTDAAGNVYEGSLTYLSETSAYLRYVANSAYVYLYLELDDETLTFTVLDMPSETYYLRGDDWEISDEVTLFIDGKGGAVYTNGETEENGTYTYTAQADGSYLYTFVGENGTQFNFLLLTMSNTSVFVRYNEDIAGTLIATDYGVLMLDGFASEATYTDLAGNTYAGQYSVVGNVLYLRVFDEAGALSQIITIDLTGDTFTVRDGFDGSYLLLENNVMVGGMLITLDGYGNFTYQIGEDETELSGTYTIADEANAELVITYGGASYHIVLGVLGDYSVFSFDDEGAGIFLSSAWEFFLLDGFGMLTYIDERGFVYEGNYTRLADGVVYMSCSGVLAGVYRINGETGVATYIDNGDYLGFYVADDNSYLYLQTSFSGADTEAEATMGGYYTIENGTVTLYVRDSATDNDYYFTAMTGTYQNGIITVDGKAYTLADTYLSTANDGFLFFRSDVTADTTYGAFIYVSDGSLVTEVVAISMTREDGELSIVFSLSDGTRYYATVDEENNSYTVMTTAISIMIAGETEEEFIVITEYYDVSDDGYYYTLAGSLYVGEDLVTFDEQPATAGTTTVLIWQFFVFNASFAHTDGYSYDIQVLYNPSIGAMIDYTRYLVTTVTNGEYSIVAYQLVVSTLYDEEDVPAMSIRRLGLYYGESAISLITFSEEDGVYNLVSADAMYEVTFTYGENGVVTGFTIARYALASASYGLTTVYYAIDEEGSYYTYAYATYSFTSGTELLDLVVLLEAAPDSYVLMLRYGTQYLLFYFTPGAEQADRLVFAQMTTLTTDGYSVTVFYDTAGNVLWLYELNTVAEDGTETEVWNFETSTEGTVVMTAAGTFTLTVGDTVYTIVVTSTAAGPQSVTVTAETTSTAGQAA